MSELTQCNFCSLERTREQAAKRGATVEVFPDPEQGGWLAVQASDEDKPHQWFLDLSDHCVC